MIQEKKFNSASDIYKYFKMPQFEVSKFGAQKAAAFQNLNQDTFINSSKEKIKKLPENKKAALAFTAFAAAILAIKALSKFRLPINFNKAQQYFSKMFSKNLTGEETQQIIENYKKIMKIDKPEEFASRLFDEVKKNFGYKNKEIRLILVKTETIADELKHPADGGAALDEVYVKLSWLMKCQKRKISALKKKKLFDVLHHEFRHIKQNEFAYRTEPDEFIESLIGKYSDEELENIAKKAFSDEKIKNLSEQGRDLKEEAALIMKKECSVLFDSLYGDSGRFEKGSNEYKKGLEYINAEKKYRLPKGGIMGQIRYKNNLLEKEAFKVSDMARQIFRYLKKKRFKN